VITQGHEYTVNGEKVKVIKRYDWKISYS
jgi:hypothetical protein